jgi:HemY protein
LTARALELEKVDRDRSRDTVMEAIKLAPTLVPAAVLASKYQSEAHQIRRSMRIVEAAWLAQPHPDLADAYAHVRLGDSARQRLVRVETLAAKVPGHLESALAVARTAIDATEFTRAREALAPFVAAPTQRVAMLMAEIERTEHGDSGRARAWTLRAVRALHDPVWTADGYVSASWRPVSPVSGRIDAFQWLTPLAALPSDKNPTVDASPFEQAMLAAPRRAQPPNDLAPNDLAPSDLPLNDLANDLASDVKSEVRDELPRDVTPAVAIEHIPAAQDNSPAPVTVVEPVPAAAPSSPRAESSDVTAAPLFRPRADIPKDPSRGAPAGIPAVIPIVRAPDDPGIDEEAVGDEFAEPINSVQGQAGGWRGFLSRWGG